MSPRFLWQSDSPAGNRHTVSREGKQKTAELQAQPQNQIRGTTSSQTWPSGSKTPCTPLKGPLLASYAKAQLSRVPARHCQARATGFSCRPTFPMHSTHPVPTPHTLANFPDCKEPMANVPKHHALCLVLLWGWPSSLRKIVESHLWRYAKAIWTRSWAIGCSCLSPAQVPSSFNHPVTF